MKSLFLIPTLARGRARTYQCPGGIQQILPRFVVPVEVPRILLAYYLRVDISQGQGETLGTRPVNLFSLVAVFLGPVIRTAWRAISRLNVKTSGVIGMEIPRLYATAMPRRRRALNAHGVVSIDPQCAWTPGSKSGIRLRLTHGKVQPGGKYPPDPLAGVFAVGSVSSQVRTSRRAS